MSRAIVEVAFGYTLTSATPVWTDLTSRVDMATGITIERGAQDEQSETQSGTATLTLDNSDGALTPDRSASPYSPNVKKNVPIRVSVATLDTPTGSAPYPLAQLADDFDDNSIDTTRWTGSTGGVSEVGGRARVPCATGVSAAFTSARQWTLTGSWTTVRVVTIPSGAGTNARCQLMVNSVTDGTRIGFEVNATAGTLVCINDVAFSDGGLVILPHSPSAHAWLRIRESAGTVFWETSPDGYAWTVRRSVATPAWVGTDQVELQLLAARDAGTADFAEFDLLGAQIHPRFFGMVNNWPTKWKGMQGKTSITCTDVFKWSDLENALLPMLSQEVLLDKPTAYFPLTEEAGATSAGDLSGTAGVGTLAVTQAGTGGTLEFAAGTGPNNCPAPVFTPSSTSNGKYLAADLGQGMVDANLNFRARIEAWFSTSTNGRVLLAIASVDASTRVVVLLESGTGKLALEKDQAGDGPTTTVFPTANLADGQLHHLVYNEFTNDLVIDGTTYNLFAFNNTDMRMLTVGAYAGTRLWAGTISHVAVYCRSVTAAELAGHYTTGTTAHVGETAAARMSRLASYVGLTVSTQGATFDPIASQAELGQSALTHMREIETTESGKLLASRSAVGLVFQSRDLRYNPTSTLTLAYADLETDDVELSDDDQKMVNTVVASRPEGATQRIINQSAIDTYGPKPRTLSLLKTSDNSVADAANWLVSRYSETPPEIRQVPIHAYSMPLATYRTLLGVDVSTILGLTGLPDQAPAATATLVIEGYGERISAGQHLLDFHTSRAQTDSVWVLDDPTYSVLGSTTRLAY